MQKIIRPKLSNIIKAFQLKRKQNHKVQKTYIDTIELKKFFGYELRYRKVGNLGDYAYANFRGGESSFYATTAVVNIFEILGLNFGEYINRINWSHHILSFQNEDLSFDNSNQAHALCMAIQALNILGYSFPYSLGKFAPIEKHELKNFIDEHDWTSTHKNLWGMSAPLLCGGLVGNDWIDTFRTLIEIKLTDHSLDDFWCCKNDEPWKIISKIYHISAIFDCFRLPYPNPNKMITKLLSLDWPTARLLEKKTYCTDADWAWLLFELNKQVPEYSKDIFSQIRKVSKARVYEWASGFYDWSIVNTHDIYCYLWSTALYQSIQKNDYKGPCIFDTLNQPHLFRIVI